MSKEVRRRRYWSDGEKRRIVAETYEAGSSVSVVARRYDVNANLVFTWRRDPRFNGDSAAACFLPVEVVDAEGSGVTDVDAEAFVPKGTANELGRGVRVCFGDAVTEASLLRIVSALRSAS